MRQKPTDKAETDYPESRAGELRAPCELEALWPSEFSGKRKVLELEEAAMGYHHRSQTVFSNRSRSHTPTADYRDAQSACGFDIDTVGPRPHDDDDSKLIRRFKTLSRKPARPSGYNSIGFTKHVGDVFVGKFAAANHLRVLLEFCLKGSLWQLREQSDCGLFHKANLSPESTEPWRDKQAIVQSAIGLALLSGRPGFLGISYVCPRDVFRLVRVATSYSGQDVAMFVS